MNAADARAMSLAMPKSSASPMAKKPALSKVEAQALLEKRRATDPLEHYKPGPTIAACFASDALYRMLAANNQVGKTTGMQVEACRMLRGKHPFKPWFGPLRILIVVPSRAQAAVVWGQRLLEKCELKGEIGKYPFIPKREIKKCYNAYSPVGPYPGSIHLKNGSSAYIILSGDKNSWKRIEGMTFDYIFRDEADGNENLGDELQLRIVKAQDNPEKPWAGGILWGFTSTKINDEAEVFAQRCKDGVKTAVGRHEYFFIEASENPAVSMEARGALAEVMSAEAYAIRGVGRGTAADNERIYMRYWDENRHVRKSRYVIQPTDNLWIVYDPGWRHPCGIGCFAINQKNPMKLILCRFYCYKYGTRQDHMASMAEWLAGRTAVGLVCDPAILKTESNGRSFFSLMDEEKQSHGINLYRDMTCGRNRNEDGIPLVIDYLEKNLLEVDGQGDGCQDYIGQMLAYRYEKDKDGTLTSVIHKKKDEAPDCTKYLCSKRPMWADYGDHRPAIDQAAVPQIDGVALSPDEALHRSRLLMSQAMIADLEDSSATPLGVSFSFSGD
jgi:hypothetical protein